MKPQAEIVYVGSLATAEIACGRYRYSFINRKPRMVPQAAADQLLRQKEFCRVEDLVVTMEERFQGGSVLVKRWGALGDLLMVRALLAAFRRSSPHYRFGLWCDERWESLFASDRFFDCVNPDNKQVDQSISFDQVAEQDHRGSPESRIDLMMKILTQKRLQLTAEDWRIPVPEATSKYVDAWMKRHRPGPTRRLLIGVQVRGSGLMKSMPPNQIRTLVTKLTELGDVVLIENEKHRVWQQPGVLTMVGKDALHSIELLRQCDLCVCFDSGVLWMAHAAACPVLCIMGPTRPKQRLTYHPLYQEEGGGARAICLNDIVQLNGKRGCPACFEAADACKQTYACMQRQPDSVVDLIVHDAHLMLNRSVSLPVVVNSACEGVLPNTGAVEQR